MKKFLLGSVAFAMLAGPAAAADLPAKAPIYKAPPPVMAYSWTGCYIGGNAGGLWTDKDWSDPATGDVFAKHHANGFLGGVQVGCNYQTGAFVFGVQGDYDWTDADGQGVDLFDPATTERTRVRGLASVTGRVGYAWDRALLYVKGGGAWERDRFDFLDTATGVSFATASETRGGWTFGGGIEYAFWQNWTAFVEYDYYDFGRHRVTFTDTGGGIFDVDIKERKSVVKGGINWKFDWGGPVVARY